jgi:hypothetical protein
MKLTCMPACPVPPVWRASVPRDGSGFTLLFEALLIAMARTLPVRTVARMVGEHDTRLWPIVHPSVEQARDAADHSEVTRVAFDETSARRGHDYVTLFADLDKRRVLFAGKDRSRRSPPISPPMAATRELSRKSAST